MISKILLHSLFCYSDSHQETLFFLIFFALIQTHTSPSPHFKFCFNEVHILYWQWFRFFICCWFGCFFKALFCCHLIVTKLNFVLIVTKLKSNNVHKERGLKPPWHRDSVQCSLKAALARLVAELEVCWLVQFITKPWHLLSLCVWVLWSQCLNCFCTLKISYHTCQSESLRQRFYWQHLDDWFGNVPVTTLGLSLNIYISFLIYYR